MADSNYLIEILLRAKDEASGQIAALKQQVRDLQAETAKGDLAEGVRDLGDEADRAAQSHRELTRQQQESRRATQQSESDIKRVAQWQQQASEATAGHAASMQELRRQQQQMPADTQRAESAVKRVAQHHDTAAESVAAHAAAHDVLGDNVDESVQSLDALARKAKDVNGTIKDFTEGTDSASTAQERLAERTGKALETFDELKQSWQEGSGDLKTLRQDLQASGRELDGLSRRFETMSDDAKVLRDVAEEARAMAKSLATLSEQSRQPTTNALNAEIQAQKERMAAQREAARVAKELNLEIERSRRETSKQIANAEIEDARRVAAARRQSSSLESAMQAASRPAYTLANPASSQQQEIQAARQMERARARLIRAGLGPDQAAESIERIRGQALGDFGFTDQEARNAAQIARAQDQAARMNLLRSKPSRDFVAEGNQLLSKMATLDQAARSHTASNAELRSGYSRLASQLRTVWREMEIGSAEARKFGDAMEQAGKKARNLDLARAAPGFEQIAQKIAAATDSIGIKIVSLSAALRGARLAGLIGLLQPLDTGLLSLAGGFFNVASGAGQAAATIGGVFVSGLGQLIPMLSVAVAGLIRFRDIFQAVQAAQAARQQSAFEPNQGLITQLQNTAQLIQSEQNLTNAYYGLHDAQVQVRESQIQLTQARIDAIRNITDLTLAEKDAQLQLRGANLSLTQAQEEERMAQASGDQMRIAQARLQVQEAELAQRRAQIQVPRSQQNLGIALSYGINGSPGVLSATEAARQARLAVIQAQQEIASAQRQQRITELTLAQPASHMSQQQATLQYLLGQMSSPEKALFTVLNNFETMLRSPNSPLKRITDAFIQPFLDAFTRLDQLMHDPKFMGIMTRLADTMGGAMKSIEQTMFGSRGTSFFETMANDASTSIPIVTRAITGLMRVFEDIARAAAPAFNRLSRDWAKFWDALDRRDSTPQGQARLTAFFNRGAQWAEDFGKLAVAIYDLFRALGHDAAPQGMSTITTFTEAIHDATNWVQTHGPEVTRFFSQARQGLSLIGGVVWNVLKDMVKLFDLSSIQAFSTFLNTVVLPAATNVARAIGFIVTSLMKFFNLLGAPGRVALEAIVTGFLGLLALNRVIGVVTKATNVINGLKDAWTAYQTASDISWFSRIGAAWDALTQRITKGRTAIQAATTAQTELDAASTVGMGETAVGAGASTAATAGGGGGLLGGLLARIGIGGGLGGAASLLGWGGLILGGGYLANELLQQSVQEHYKGFSPDQVLTGTGNYTKQSFGGAFPYADVFASTRTGSPLSRLIQQVGSGQIQPGAGSAYVQQFLQQAGSVNIAQSSSQSLSDLRTRAEQLMQLPDITSRMRSQLAQLASSLDPVSVKLTQIGQQWSSTFQGISATTGNVMQQVQQTLAQDIQNISSNLGTGTQEGATALVASFQSALNAVMSNTTAMVRGTAAGMKVLDTMLKQALSALGVSLPGSILSGAGWQGAGNLVAWAATARNSTNGISTRGGSGHGLGYAAGGWHSATPGGRGVVVGEGGHDEVTLTTDPRYAPRSRALLGQYLAATPHLAGGGYVYPIPGFTLGRTDMGIDANAAPGTPIGAIGNSKLTGVIPNWYQGQPLLNFQLLDGPDAGRFWYVAEQIIPVTETIGSIFRAGQAVARYAPTGTGIEMGWSANAAGTTLAQATGQTGDSSHGNAPAGVAFRSFISGLAHGVISGGNAVLQMLKAPKFQGPGGALGAIGQGALNQITQAANAFIAAQSGGNMAMSGIAPGSWMQVASQIASRFKWGAAQLQAWLGVEKIEDASFSLTAKNPTSNAYGLAQGITGPSWYYGYGGNPNSLVGQLTGMGTYIHQRYGTPEAALAHEHQYGWYAAGGLLANHIRRMGLRHLRRKALHFADGGRAPWGGYPVPIVAHEGERVVNPPQWDELGRLTGMGPRGLDSHLGYDTGHPKQHFAGGGSVSSIVGAQSNFLTGVTTNLYTADPGSIAGALNVVTKVFQAVMKGLNAIGRLGGSNTKSLLTQLDTLVNALDNQTDGALLQLSNAFQRYQSNLTNWVTSMSFRLTAMTPNAVGRLVQGRFRRAIGSGGFAGVTAAGGPLTANTIGTVGTTESDLLNERALTLQSKYIGEQEKAVSQAISRIRQNIRRVQHSSLSSATKKNVVADLESNYTALIQQQEQLAGAMNSNITSRYQAEQQYIQDRMTQISDVYQTQQSQIQARQSAAQSFGRYGQLPSLDRALATSSANQIAALQKVLKEAQKIGDHDLVAQTKQQIAQLRTTIAQATAQMISDSISGIQQSAQTTGARVSELQSISQTRMNAAATAGQFASAGALNAQALMLNGQSIQSQIAQYSSLLSQAQAQGNQGAVATLTQTIDGLTAQLVQNQQALQDNTTTMVANATQFIQGRGQFATGVYGGLGQIIQTIGQTTGYTDVGALKGLLTGSNTALQGTQQGLLGQLGALGGGASSLAAALSGASTPAQFAAILGGANIGSLEAGQDSTWINTFESLISNLTSNTEVIATNNQQLATLNGQLLQPQSWSTSTWSAFRDAVFTGMGNLLPQYQTTLTGTAIPTIAPGFGPAGTNIVPGGSGTMPVIAGDLNVSLTHPVEQLNPFILGEQLAHAVSTSLT